MTVIASSLAVMLALQGAAPSSPSEKCQVTDNRCKAEQFVQRAAAAASPRHRALYLHAAHRSYLALFDQTGEVRDLCAARRTFDQSLAIEDQPDSQRASFEAVRQDLTSRERATGARCSSPSKRPAKAAEPPQTPDPPLLVAEPSPAPDAQPATAEPARRMVEPAPTPDPADALLAVPSRPRPAPAPAVAPTLANDAPPGRRLVIAGGLTLGAGLALTGLAASMGSRLIDTRRKALDLADTVEGFATEAQLAEGDRLENDYRRQGPQTLALALAAGTTVVVAAVLLGVGGRRMARAASRTALVPVPGGLAFHARF